MKTFGFAIVMVALFVVVALIGSASFAGPFNRCPVVVESNVYPTPAVAAPIAAAPEPTAQATGALADRHLLPCNCPNGNCRKPREEVNVTVNTPRYDECKQPVVSVHAETEEEPFPYGALIAVVAGVTILAGVAAFFIRVSGSGS